MKMLLVLAFLLTNTFGAGVDIYLDSLTGNDKWSGLDEKPNTFQTSGPIKSISRGQEIIADLTKNIRLGGARPDYIKVHLNGEFIITSPLIMDADDAGIDESLPVEWTGGVINGGLKLDFYKENELYYANWPIDSAPISLFINGSYAQKAREPDGSFFTIKAANLATENPTGFAINTAEVPLAKKGTFNILHYWNHEIRTPSSVSDAGVVSVSPAFVRRLSETFDNKNYARYYLSGHKDFIDENYEWAYDKATNRIWVKAPADFEGFVGYQKELLSIWNTRHIVFNNVKFINGGWSSDKFLDGQSSVVPAQRMSENFIGWNSRYISFQNCEFRNMSGYGLDLNSNAKNISFDSCSFVNCGNGGIKIGEVYSNSEPYISRDINFTNNSIINFGLTYHGGAGVLITKARNVVVDNNIITNGQHNGISAGWQWFYGDSLTSDIKITNNKISNLGPYLSDLGGIYTLGEQPGTIISGNEISNISRAPNGYGARGIYLDQASSYIKIYDNIVLGKMDHPYFQHWKGKGVEHDPNTNLSSTLPFIQKPEQ